MTTEIFRLDPDGWWSLTDGVRVGPGPVPALDVITNGYQLNETNTGIAGRGLTEADLTVVPGATYNTPQTVTRKLFTGQVNVNAPVNFVECMSVAQGQDMMCFRLNAGAVGTRFDWVTIRPPDGASAYEGILSSTADIVIYRSNLSRCENIVTYDTDGPTWIESWCHDPSDISSIDGHKDIIEGFSGADARFIRSKATMPPDETAPINLAPWWPEAAVDGFLIEDSFIDGGVAHILIDAQQGYVHNVKVIRTDMGGHSFPEYGWYRAFHNSDGRPTVETEAEQLLNPEAVWWPSSGEYAGRWQHCEDIVPDRTGEYIVP